MTGGGKVAQRLRLALLAALCAALAPPGAASALGDAISLYHQKEWPKARAVLAPLVAADPSNAAATYFLGMTLLKEGGQTALDSAHDMLARATRLDPQNESYLADYAGVCLLLADRDASLSYAIEGRDAMARAIMLDPADLEAREGLMEFYAKAPWPIGDADKAVLQASEIGRRDPRRGCAAYGLIAGIFEKTGRKERALAARQAAQRLAPELKP